MELINTMPPQKSGPEATVIISTFGRADFIVWPLKSAQQQTVEDIEILVVGDGSSAETGELVREAAGKDPRIRFFDNLKGERNGERHRHQAVLQSRGNIICYLGHDDLWFPGHVAAMRSLLREADFAHSLYTYIGGDGAVHGLLPLISDPSCRARMRQDQWNRFGPTCAAHTREIYAALPFGWRPAPQTVWSDLYMWRQFMDQPGCRFAGLHMTTTVSFPRSLRKEYSIERRDAELADWFPRLSLTDEAQRLSQEAVQSAAGDLHREIFDLANRALENLRRLPASQAARPSASGRFLGVLYGFIDKLRPGRLTALKDRLIKLMIARSGLFDERFYLEKYPGTFTAGSPDPLGHYMREGWKSGNNPSPGFDNDYYLAIHQDVLRAGMNPLVHYIRYGFRERRMAIRLLNEQGGKT